MSQYYEDEDETRAISADEVLVRLRTGMVARVIAGSKGIDGKPSGYLVAIMARERHVCTFGAWGPQEKFAAHRGKLEAAIRSVRVGPLWRLLLTLL